MNTVGTFMPVWNEPRYLSLVLQQMERVPGPRVVLWMDEPLFWLGDGEAPSGHANKDIEILLKAHDVTVVKMKAPPSRNDEFGGFANVSQFGCNYLAKNGADTIVWLDSDWLFELFAFENMIAAIQSAPPTFWNVPARHYWRTFKQVYASSNVLVAFPTKHGQYPWDITSETPIQTFEGAMCHHPSYVLSDAECYQKVNSFGHAPLFKDREFYAKEWLGGDDSQMKPEPAEALPAAMHARLDRVAERHWL